MNHPGNGINYTLQTNGNFLIGLHMHILHWVHDVVSKVKPMLFLQNVVEMTLNLRGFHKSCVLVDVLHKSSNSLASAVQQCKNCNGSPRINGFN